MSCKLTDIPNYNSNVGGRFKRMKFGISSGVDEYNRGNKMVSTASSFSINSDAVTIGSSYNEPGLFYKLTANRTDAGMQVEYFKVTPELRKQGIAVKMHLEAFEDAKRRGLNLISDSTISRPAMAIYMKLKEMGYSVRLSPDARVSTVPSLEGDAQIYTDGGGPVVTVNTATRGNPNPGEPSFIENQYNNNPKENLGGSSYQTVKDEDGYVRLKKNNFKQNLEGVSTYKGVPSAIEDVANAAMDAGYHISLRQDSVIVIVPVPPGDKKIKIKVRDMKEMDELLSLLDNKPLEMKVGQSLSKRVMVQENSGPLEGYDEVGSMFVRDYKGKRRYAPTKKVVLYHGTPASELEGGSFNLDSEYNQGGTDWMQGVHATPDINTAKRYYEDGGSVYAIGYNINKVWHLSGNKISNKMLLDYEKTLKDKGFDDRTIKHLSSEFANSGKFKRLSSSEQTGLLLKHGYNLVLDGSHQVVMLEPSESGTSPLRLDDKEINNALSRRKKANKSMQVYNRLVDNKRKSDRKREDIDKEWKDRRSDRYYQQLIGKN